MFTQEYNFDNAQEFMNFIAPWNSSFSNFIYRGHSDENYELLPVSLRKNEFNKLRAIYSSLSRVPYKDIQDTAQTLMKYELRIIREFYKLSDSSGLNVPVSPEIRSELSLINGENILSFTDDFPDFKWLPEKLWELAALTQHYGLPTRLLDWTYDPFIAAYFASCSHENTDSSKRLCIWGLNKEKISFSRVIYEGLSDMNFITPHYSGNPNITAQKGIFTHFSEKIDFLGSAEPDRIPLDEKIKSFIPDDYQTSLRNPYFIKVTLPKSEAPLLFNLLSISGYGTARLFPGYDGVAKQLLEKIKPSCYKI